MDLVTFLQGNKISSLIHYEISFHGQENPRGTKNIPPLHPDQEPGWHQACVFQLSPFPISPSHKAPPHSSSNRIAFDFLSFSFQLWMFCLFPLQPVGDLPLGLNKVAWGSYIQSLIEYIHHFHWVGGDYISEKDLVCHSYERVSSVHVRKCIYCLWWMWGTVWKTGTLCFYLTEVCQ